jgi:hypothetical protein
MSVDAALKLAATFVPVFPARLCPAACLQCKICKAPATPRGFYSASTDADTIRHLWRNYPGPLIGVPTGAVSGFDVLDIDLPRHQTARDWWQTNQHRIGATWINETGSGGLHVRFKHNGSVRCGAGRFALGVDTRGAGGYIIAWAQYGCRVLSDAPLAPWPDWLLEQLKPKPRPTITPVALNSHGDYWLRGLVRTIANAPEGQRNCILFWAACRAGEAVRSGKANEDFCTRVLLEAAIHAGLALREAQRTILSGIQRS